MVTLNLSICEYQRLLVITKVIWVNYFIQGS